MVSTLIDFDVIKWTKITVVRSSKNKTRIPGFSYPHSVFYSGLSESERSPLTVSQGVGTCSLCQRSAKAKQLLIKTADAH